MDNITTKYPDILEILKLAREMGASDLHLSAGHPPAARLQGILSPMNLPSLTPEIMSTQLDHLLNLQQRLEAGWKAVGQSQEFQDLDL